MNEETAERIATALEKLAKKGEESPENQTRAVFFIGQLEHILDTCNNEFILRRELRKFLERQKASFDEE